jgi:hypothetical protein
LSDLALRDGLNRAFGKKSGEEATREAPALPVMLTRAEIPVEQWPSSWLGLSRFDGIAMSEAELAQSPPAVRDAISRWTSAGGSLLLTESHASAECQAAGTMFLCDEGFGQVFRAPMKIDQLGDEDLEILVRSWRESSIPSQTNLAEYNPAMRVAPGATVPIGGLYLNLVVFAIVAGPVTLIILARKRKQILIFVVVPALALASSIAMVVYSFAHEGFIRTMRLESLTYLDQRAARATTIGWLGYYSTTTPRDGLQFDADTELEPRNTRGLDNNVSIDWSNGQTLHGWVRSRVTTHLLFRKSEPRRERIELRHRNGGVFAVNGLGAPVARLWIEDRNGVTYYAANIPAGAEARVTPAAAPDTPLQLRSLYAGSWFDISQQGAANRLLPGSYLAQLSSTLFVESGLRKPREKKIRSSVFGIMRRDVDES